MDEIKKRDIKKEYYGNHISIIVGNQILLNIDKKLERYWIPGYDEKEVVCTPEIKKNMKKKQSPKGDASEIKPEEW